ncbi:MAG TPA: hypothetical protein VHY34_06130 [Caulobacteraceae bacterium]|nr:hypothetical protein [Caulobacteraceae bacterium]
MAESTRPDDLEGWGVRWPIALVAGGGVALFVVATLAGAHVLYHRAGAPTAEAQPAERFPAPTLNAHLDADPRWSFAPAERQMRSPDPQVLKAMAELAAQGDGAYGPSGRRP